MRVRVVAVAGLLVAAVGAAFGVAWPGVLGAAAVVAAVWSRADAPPSTPVELVREPARRPRPPAGPWAVSPALGLVLVDHDDVVRQASTQAVVLLGLTEPVVGRPLLDVGPPPELVAAVEASRSGAPEETEVKGVADLVLHPVRVDGGGVLVVVEDRGPLVEAERSRTDFVANVSHELRTPLAAVMGFAETALLDRERLPDDVAENFDAIWRNATRLRDLFAALLRLHRIEMRRRDLPLEPLPLAPILRSAVVDAEASAARAGLHFSVDCDPTTVAWVQEDALATAVGNLASNAVRYTPAGGSVHVVARPEGDEVVVEVVDTGVGIDSVHHERIFERFYRVDDGRTRAAGGSGIGLAIVKHVARAAGWKLGLDSAPGRGSTFRLHLRAGGRG